MSEEFRVEKRGVLFLSGRPFLLFALHLVLPVVGTWAAVLAIGVAPAVALDYTVVEGVSHVSAADYTRIIITLSEKTPHQLFTVPADPKRDLPARIVVDFAPARRGAGAPLSLAIHDGLLKQVRTGQFSLTTTRVVLDIEKIDDYKTFMLYSPYRLIIDVKGKVQRETAKGPQPPPRSQTPEQYYTIMLDPGHGGKDPGAMGDGRVPEKDVVLAISKRLGRKLASRLPVKILYTRTTDVFVPLEERIARANVAKTDLFVSIHANASTNLDLQGVETYYLNNTNDRATIRLAALENGFQPRKNSKDDSEDGLSYLLSDLIQSGKEEDSIALAYELQDSVVNRAKEYYPAVHNLGVKKGPFYVLVGAHMPCVLVETAFITHRVEGKHLISSEYQETLAEGLYLGIARFLRTGRLAKSL